MIDKSVSTTKPADGPPDGGWGWLCVLGQLYCYVCILGIASSFGIIYIELIEYFHTSREVTAWIGSLANGLRFLICPFASFLTSKLGIQKTVAAGTLLAFSGCFISWFATGIPYLYVTYGIMIGSGLGLIFLPSTIILVFYFKKRLGLAMAIGTSGAGLGTLVLPPLFTYLIEQFGWRGTLLLLSGLILNCLPCAFIFRPPQYIPAASKYNSNSSKSVFVLLCNSAFTMFIFAAAVAQLCFIVPVIHLPDMVIQSGMEKYRAAYLISIIGVSNIVGRIILGWISDLACVNIILLHGVALIVCGVVTAASTIFTQFYALAVYSVIQGTGIGVYSAFNPVIISLLVGVDRAADGLGLTAFLSGIIAVVASPIAGLLFDMTGSYHVSFYLAGSAFVMAGVMDLIVLVLQRRQAPQEMEVEIQMARL